MKVFVYFNLHKKVWSIRAMEGPQKGRVIKHAETVALHNVKPKVSEAGRRRVISEQRKNVHAGIVGELIETGKTWFREPIRAREITYNPYKGPSFTYRDQPQLEFTRADWARLTAEGRKVHVWNYDPAILYELERDAVEGTWEDATC